MPSVAASLIERLPDENDPQWPMEKKFAQDVAVVSYIGAWRCKRIDSSTCTRTIH